MMSSNTGYLKAIFKKNADSNNYLSSMTFFGICKLLNLYPELVSFEKCKKIITKDKMYWPNEPIDDSDENDKSKLIKPVYFSFKDFVKAFEFMAQPDSKSKRSPADEVENKVKFFSQLHNAIERIGSK